MIRRFFRYCTKVFDLPRISGCVRDGREKPEISGTAIWLSMLLLFVLHLPSLNALEEIFRNPASKKGWRRLLGDRPPSADAIGYYSERVGVDSLRQLIHILYTRLQRNRHLSKFRLGSWLMLAVDGHELFSSYVRHCPHCLRRTVQTKQGERTQYYHRVVVACLVGGPIPLPLDAEEIRPGEQEIGAALRLLERIQAHYPKAYDVLTGDALYADPRIVSFLHSHNKRLIAVLKENHPDLIEDARSLCERIEPTRHQQGDDEYTWWDSEGFTTWSTVESPVRVVRSQETKKVRGERVTSDWFWVTTFSCAEASTRSIWQGGHGRWDIENQGFNYLVNHCDFNHPFHHEGNAILAFVLTNLIAYVLTSAFYRLNLKPQARRQCCLTTVIQLFWLSLDEFLKDRTRIRPRGP